MTFSIRTEGFWILPWTINLNPRKLSTGLTTEFGQTRYVNNAPTSYPHSGLDIATPTGTPILAANNGRVTLSMDLILTGNTVVIGPRPGAIYRILSHE